MNCVNALFLLGSRTILCFILCYRVLIKGKDERNGKEAIAVPSRNPNTFNERRHVAQSVERRIQQVKVRGLKPVLGTWWWGRTPPNQPYLKGCQVLDYQDLGTDNQQKLAGIHSFAWILKKRRQM